MANRLKRNGIVSKESLIPTIPNSPNIIHNEGENNHSSMGTPFPFKQQKQGVIGAREQ